MTEEIMSNDNTPGVGIGAYAGGAARSRPATVLSMLRRKIDLRAALEIESAKIAAELPTLTEEDRSVSRRSRRDHGPSGRDIVFQANGHRWRCLGLLKLHAAEFAPLKVTSVLSSFSLQHIQNFPLRNIW